MFFEKNLPLNSGAEWNDYSPLSGAEDDRFAPYDSQSRAGGAKPPLKKLFPRGVSGKDGRNYLTHGGLL